jgi:hypothetical protein
MIGLSLKNIDIVIKNLGKKISKIENGSIKGLTIAALRIRRAAQQKTPVDEGNLRASAYTETFKTSRGPAAAIGYTAKYASWVHEMPGKLAGKPRPKKKGSQANRGLFWDPQGKAEPKFLEKALIENEDNFLNDIKRHTKV